MFIVGKILNTHGLKGEVRVRQITDFPDRFQEGNTLYIEREEKTLSLMIKTSRVHKNDWLLQFEGYESIDKVEWMKGLQLFIDESQLTPLEEGEYYYYEIIGCTVYSTDGEYIGEIESILAPGANDVWVIRNEENKEILIPYIPDVVKDVDVERKKVIIEVMEGLIE